MDPVFNRAEHNVISLEAILAAEATAIAQAKHEFETRGWCIVRLPESGGNGGCCGTLFSSSSIEALHFDDYSLGTLSFFFSQTDNTKIMTNGYTQVPHKETLHLFTPFSSSSLPSHTSTQLQKWCNSLDSLADRLISVLAQPVFERSPRALTQEAGLPCALGSHMGMLDVMRYRNIKYAVKSPDIGESTEEVNCVPHFDPGLFTISFLSTHDGLQLRDPTTDTWFAGPVNTKPGQEDLAVLWLGEAAEKVSGGRLKSCVHCVVYPEHPTPRITAFYEVCTLQQANDEVREHNYNSNQANSSEQPQQRGPPRNILRRIASLFSPSPPVAHNPLFVERDLGFNKPLYRE